eukprot:m.84458 g.84458  ORF g.84458 m.84458 type:complete len:58 (-) comp12967_c0_seq3:97-270(-)
MHPRDVGTAQHPECFQCHRNTVTCAQIRSRILHVVLFHNAASFDTTKGSPAYSGPDH